MYSSFQIIFVALIACIYVVSAAPINQDSQLSRRSSSYKGDGTFYTPGLGSCGSKDSEKDMVVALNHGQMNNGSNSNKNGKCGKKITVKGPKGKATVKVVDTCPSCGSGDLDLSPAAFKKIGDMSKGRVPITWSWN